MIDGSTTPLTILVGGLIGFSTLVLPLSVVVPGHLTNAEESIKINKVGYKN